MTVDEVRRRSGKIRRHALRQTHQHQCHLHSRRRPLPLLLVESVVVLVAGDSDVRAAFLERKGSPPWLLSFDQKKMKTWPKSKSNDDRFIEEVD